jgi:dTDP-4-dehydrorhamnose reductase
MPDAGGSSFDTHAAVLAAPRPVLRPRRRVLVTGAAGMLGSDLSVTLAGAGTGFAQPKSDLDIADEVGRGGPAGLRPDVVIAAAFTSGRVRDPRAFEISTSRRSSGRRLQARPVTDADLDGLRIRWGEARALSGTIGHRCQPTGRKQARGRGGALRLPGSLVVRASWLFGRCGWNFVEAILKQVEDGKKRLSVVTDQVGRPTATTDLSEAILALLEAGASGVYHFANRGEVSWNEFAREILWLAGRTDVAVEATSSAALARPAVRPAYSVLDTGKYERLTGRPIRHFRDPLAEYLARRTRPEA